MRVLLRLGRGSMAHFELAPGRVSRAVGPPRRSSELWYILGRAAARCGGARRERQQTVPLRPGTCLSIPAGTHFQFRVGTAAARWPP